MQIELIDKRNVQIHIKKKYLFILYELGYKNKKLIIVCYYSSQTVNNVSLFLVLSEYMLISMIFFLVN